MWPFVMRLSEWPLGWVLFSRLVGSRMEREEAAIRRMPSPLRVDSRLSKVAREGWSLRRRVGRVIDSMAEAARAEVCHLLDPSRETYCGSDVGTLARGMCMLAEGSIA